jgi:DNA-binding response OmpR family regulator
MHLLLIEDDTRVARFIQKGLQAERHVVEMVFDGPQGLEMALTRPYDLIVLDLLLPSKNGLDVCRELRGHGIHVPVLMLTARDAIEDRVLGFAVGADDYLVKPFAFEELVARIRSLLRRATTVDLAPALAVADLTLDKDRHEVRRGGTLVALTPKEFALLECLMRHPDRAVSRTMIEQHVWSYARDSLTNVVDVYIRRLRKKVNRGSRHKLIHTIRGVGYKLTT